MFYYIHADIGGDWEFVTVEDDRERAIELTDFYAREYRDAEMSASEIYAPFDTIKAEDILENYQVFFDDKGDKRVHHFWKEKA